jgi:SpoVK/Ycf46/Vps4 family AAA+-type ATPase
MIFVSGADLTALIHEASTFALKDRLAGRIDIDAVSRRHFEIAMEHVRPSVDILDMKQFESTLMG